MPNFFSKCSAMALALSLLTIDGATLRAQTQSTEGNATKISIPWRNRDGILVAQITGEKVRMRPDKKAEIEELVAQAFRDAKVDWTLSTPFCIMDQETREAVGDAPIHIVSKEVTITGTGFHWLANESRLIVRSKVKVSIVHGLTKS